MKLGRFRKAHYAQLERFHQTSLRKIARIRWFHKVTNYDVLKRCKIGSIQSMIESAVLRWTGHVVRMDNDRIPKKLLYGRLASGKGSKGNHASYRNQVRHILQAGAINPANLESLAKPRSAWRTLSKAVVAQAESDRINRLIDKRELRKRRAILVTLQPP